MNHLKYKWYLYVIGAMGVAVAYHEWKLHKKNATSQPVAFDPAAYGASSSDVPSPQNSYGGGIFSDVPTTAGTDTTRSIGTDTSQFVPGLVTDSPIPRGPSNNYSTVRAHGAVLNQTIIG